MELVAIDHTRVIHLYQVHRPAGQAYLPDMVGKLMGRYSFAKVPALPELLNPPSHYTFGVGKFLDTQIQELRVYSDGIIAEARSNSKILDAFIDDLMRWHETELGLVPLITSKPEHYYESGLVVQSSKDLASVMQLPPNIVSTLNRMMGKAAYKARPMMPVGFVIDCDSQADGSRRKQEKFLIERRIGASFEEKTFYSLAPLPTDDHFAFLEELEGLAT